MSETRSHQVETVEADGLKLHIIDTMGIGDTKLENDQAVLNKLAEACHLVRNGVHQVIFVTSGKFTEEEIEAYDILRTVIFNRDIVKHTTIIRAKSVSSFFNFSLRIFLCVQIKFDFLFFPPTSFSRSSFFKSLFLILLVFFRFPYYKDKEECETDKSKLIAENPKIADVIQGCRKVIWFDNKMEVEDPNLDARKDARKVLMTHIAGCVTPYNPSELKDINSRIGSYMSEKNKLKAELEKIQAELLSNKNINQELRNQLEQQKTGFKERIKRSEEEIARVTKELNDSKAQSRGRRGGCIIL